MVLKFTQQGKYAQRKIYNFLEILAQYQHNIAFFLEFPVPKRGMHTAQVHIMQPYLR